MKKKAKDLKKGDIIKIAGKTAKIEEIEFSDIGGKAAVRDIKSKKKCRIVAVTEKGEKIVIIRPDEYPFETG